LYVGSNEDPTGALLRVNTDANEGLYVIRATNLAQAVVESSDNKFPPTYPALQGHDDFVEHEVHAEPEFSGHDWHVSDPVKGLYFPATHAVQTLPLGHVVFVRSTPFNMLLYIAVVAASLRYSSTTNAPAMSPLMYLVPEKSRPK
jgi:hypothetical protein